MIVPRILLLLPVLTVIPAGAEKVIRETWDTGYLAKDATGTQVLGYWKFDAGAELKDSSGKGNDLVLSGATLLPEGHAGQALQCGSSPTRPHSARTSDSKGLTPEGAFTIEMWVNPAPATPDAEACYLADKKYIPNNHTDYAWTLLKPDKSGRRRMALALGFGTDSETFLSEPLELKSGSWQHLAVTYDVAGTATFYQNGSLISLAVKPGRGVIRPGTKPLYIGDRAGSTYAGFAGAIDEVRLSTGALRFENAGLTIHSMRHVWQRMETPQPVTITCTNLRQQSLTGGQLVISLAGTTKTYELPPLAAGESHETHLVPDTTLKPETYGLTATLTAGSTTVVKRMELEIVPRPAPAMPVILWGTGDLPRMKDVGFTHYMGPGVENMGAIWETRADPKTMPPAAAPDTIARNMAELDEALAAGMNIISRVSPRGFAENLPGKLRVDRDGKPYPRHDIIATDPELHQFFGKVGRSLGATYGAHPAMAATLVDTEVRDASQPSFSPMELEAYRKFSGEDIPPRVKTRGGVEWSKISGFPADRVVADDDPILKYYRWFWTEGDGWNGLHSALSDGVKATTRKGHWTFHDPAVRQPAISGAGGDVDVLSHWTYTYPDPQRIGLATDQLSAMSEASGHGQRIMKMTQLIWYRSQTAPVTNAVPDSGVPGIDQDPDAAYITIAPMHLREAFWTKLSRPVSGIMYHGWQSLVPTTSASAYKYTNPNTVHVLKELIHDVLRPLGPTLMEIPDQKAEVALLESFTSQIFARRGGYGYNNGWPADVWLALQHAHVRTDILYEETLLKDGLDGRKVLVMPDCDVLPAGIVKRIREWQGAGGKIIADGNLCPALKADWVLPEYKRTRKAAEDRAGLLAMAERIAPQAAALGYAPEVTADSPDVILRMRRAGDARYLFAINDRREAGTYVGQNGLVLENGLPTRTTITLSHTSDTIYDLTRGKMLQPAPDAPAGDLRWTIDLGPCDGRIFMILPEPIAGISAGLPETVNRGGSVDLRIQVDGSSKTAVKAVVPLEIRIRDANGKEAEGSGFHAAKDGLLNLPLAIASNEDPGAWEIRVKELASGTETTRYLTVRAP